MACHVHANTRTAKLVLLKYHRILYACAQVTFSLTCQECELLGSNAATLVGCEAIT